LNTSYHIDLNKLIFFRCYKALLVFCICLGISIKIGAQVIPIPDPEVDSSYIKLDYNTWSLRAFAIIKYQSLVLSNSSGEQIKYTPTNPFSTGVGFAYRFIILDLGIRINKDKEFKRFDLQANLVFKKHMIEILVQRYQGFQTTLNNSEEYFRDDIISDLFNYNHFYNFNNKQLSLGSSYSGNKIQKKSTGTFIVGGYLSYSKIKADSTLIPTLIDGDFTNIATLTEFSMVNIGAYFGYAYSLVLPHNFIFFGSASPGIGFNFTNATAYEDLQPPIFPAGKFHFRVSIGYYTKRIYTILGLTTNLSIVSLGEATRLRQNGGQIKLVFGYRFRSKIILTKTIDKTF